MPSITDVRSSELVSIVIPSYNHSRYLPDAVDSVLHQRHPHIEIIIVDDGSTDGTGALVTSRYAGQANIRYIHQENQGLAAARNTGIRHSAGTYLVFLDADDWLANEDALVTNLAYLEQNRLAAFVSGGHAVYYERQGYQQEKHEIVEDNHYEQLLQKNYIGMHAAVMYRRHLFDEFRFDTSLPVAEDYDLYLRIARNYPVVHHSSTIAIYRNHGSNMSGNLYKMLKYTLSVLRRQRRWLRNHREKKCLRRGLHIWRQYYSKEMVTAFLNKPVWPLSKNDLLQHFIAFRYQPKSYIRYVQYTMSMTYQNTTRSWRTLLKKYRPAVMDQWLQKRRQPGSNVPPRGKVRMGDFARVTPFSTDFGYDRGGPVDRYYIEQFLQDNTRKIRGRVLEIGDNSYTLGFGGQRVVQSDILHVDHSNPRATFVGDLSHAPHLPDNAFDCIILTQTLHLIYQAKQALETCYRILKPGGTLLLTVPGISHIHHGEWGQYWMWSFTTASMERMLGEVFTQPAIAVQAYGNVLVATAFLYAMGLPELTKQQLSFSDPQYQLIITAAATKPVPDGH